MNKVYSVFLPIILLVSTYTWTCDFEKLKTAVEHSDIVEVAYQLASGTGVTLEQKQILLDIADKKLLEKKEKFEAGASIFNKDTVIGAGLFALATTLLFKGALWFTRFTTAVEKDSPNEYLLTGIADNQKATIYEHARKIERNGVFAQIPLAIVGLCKLYKGLTKKEPRKHYSDAFGVKVLLEKHVS